MRRWDRYILDRSEIDFHHLSFRLSYLEERVIEDLHDFFSGLLKLLFQVHNLGLFWLIGLKWV